MSDNVQAIQSDNQLYCGLLNFEIYIERTFHKIKMNFLYQNID